VHRAGSATGFTRFEYRPRERPEPELTDLDRLLRRAMTDLRRLADARATNQEDVAMPGSRLVLQFSGQVGPRYAIIASSTAGSTDPDASPAGSPTDPLIVPPNSPLGRSLLGAQSGDLLRYAADDGEHAVYVLTVHNGRQG